MKLNRAALKTKDAWESAKVILPEFDVDVMCENTRTNPKWIHFGAGNIFRGFIARLQQDLLNQDLVDEGIVAVETFDYDIIDKIYVPHEHLALLVSLKADGNNTMEIIASIAEGLKADFTDASEIEKLKSMFSAPSLQMVSFTITEKGYALKNIQGEWFAVVSEDIKNGPTEPKHAMSMLTALMLQRYKAGALPISLVSMDNCSKNGEKLETAVLDIAKAWQDNGFVDSGFVAYLQDPKRVAFPWTMIDKITPRPSEKIEQKLTEIGVEDMAPLVTGRNTFIAPFVNAEVTQFLVIEDLFPNGRPALEKAGVFMTDRNTVNDCERMKVMTCLNPLHTALAVFGCLLGYTSIFEEMKDEDLKQLVACIGYKEGMPVVINPGILDPKEFMAQVINERFPNPFIPDTPQRIATDTSQKMAIRFGETIKAYISHPELDETTLTCIPLTIAAWLRYLLAVDDLGQPMAVSSDPLLGQLQEQLSGITFGSPDSYKGQIQSILSNEILFGTDLVACGLSGRIEAMFIQMISGTGAVRNLLHETLSKA